jgi:hypothetical protein
MSWLPFSFDYARLYFGTELVCGFVDFYGAHSSHSIKHQNSMYADDCRFIFRHICRWYAISQMVRRTPQKILLSGLLATAFMAHAQPPRPPETQGKTVHFDDSSTATLVLKARGEGVQIYTCKKDADWAWKLKAPDATLLDEKHHAIGKHFAGPTGPAWRLDDGSEVQGKLLSSRTQAGTIPWLILLTSSTGSEGRLSHVDAVRRSETQGGLAPSTGCDAQHPDAEVRVPYSAIYSFFDMKD